MDTSDNIVVGLFRDPARAKLAVEELKQTGFSDDQIRVTSYRAENKHAGEGSDIALQVPGAGGESRTVVAVNADGREHEALGILMRNGANNSDLPEGMVLDHGALVSSQGESPNFSPMREVESDPGANTFFGEAREPGHEDEIEIMDNPNFPHG